MIFNSELMEKLACAYGPSGNERHVAELIMAELEGVVDELYTDDAGNVIAHRKGEGRKLMFSAHMDTIALLVTFIDEKGFLRVTNVGGISPTALISQRMLFENGREGILVLDKRGEKKDIDCAEMYIDTGLPAEEARRWFAVGDLCVAKGSYYETDEYVICPAADNRTGCYALIEAAKARVPSVFDVYYVFSVLEEINTLGARCAGKLLAPDICVAVDTTVSNDSYEGFEISVKLGSGVGISAKDAGLVSHYSVYGMLCAAAEKAGIRTQPYACKLGATDAGGVSKTGRGVAAGAISIPTRYIHTPGECFCKSDLLDTVRLIEAVEQYAGS